MCIRTVHAVPLMLLVAPSCLWAQAAPATTQVTAHTRLWPELAPADNQAIALLRIGEEFRKGRKEAESPPAPEEVVKGMRPLAPGEHNMAARWLDYWGNEAAVILRIDPDGGFDWGAFPEGPLALSPENAALELGGVLIIRVMMVDAALAASDRDFPRALRRHTQLRAFGIAAELWPGEGTGIAGGGSILHADRLLVQLSRDPAFGRWAAANRQRVEPLLSELLDDRTARSRFAGVVDRELAILEDLQMRSRAKEFDWAAGWKARSVSATLGGRCLKSPLPLLQLDASIRTARVHREIFRAGEPVNKVHVKAVYNDRVLEPLDAARAPYVAEAVSYMETWLLQVLSAEARDRATALAVALAMFRAEHGGNWPASLDDLAPKYITKIPMNPSSSQGDPLKYDTAKHTLNFGSGPFDTLDLAPPDGNR